jgi:hypothetical protein
MYGNTNPGAVQILHKVFMVLVVLLTQSTNSQQSFGIATGSATWADVDYDATLSASIAAGDLLQTITVSVTGTQLSHPDFKGVRAFALASGSGYYSGIILLPQYTSYDGTDCYIHLSGSAVALASARYRFKLCTANYIIYNLQPVDNYRGDFEDNRCWLS